MRHFFALMLFTGTFIGCTSNNVKSDPAIVNLMDSAGMQGTFALMENATEQFTITNLSRYKDSAYAPLNSFFIVPTLIALDKGYINHNPSSWVSFDSTTYYQNLIAKIGRGDILKTIDSLHYGKGQVSANMNQFWMDQSLRITADEQLGFIKKLYFNELLFQKRSQEIARKIILKEDNANYRLSYIMATDTTQLSSTTKNASWMIGYVEENKHPYFFVFNTNSLQKDSLAPKNIAMLKRILSMQGFLKGVR